MQKAGVFLSRGVFTPPKKPVMYSQLPNTRAGLNKWAGGKGPENLINGQDLISGQVGNCFMKIQFGVSITFGCKLETILTILELFYIEKTAYNK